MRKILFVLFVSAVLLSGCGDNESDHPADSAVSDTVLTETVSDGTGLAETEGDPVVSETEYILTPTDGVFIITEDKYFEGVRDVFANIEEFVGETIEFEGEYVAEMINGEMVYQVYRNINVHNVHTDEDGHTHDHGMETYKVGFRIQYDGSKPMDKTFVKVIGTLELLDEGDGVSAFIQADVLEKCENPGKVNLDY